MNTYSSFLVDEVQSFIALGNSSERQQATGNIGINSLIAVPHYPQKCCIIYLGVVRVGSVGTHP
ncbi:MAG: hypothetical protein SWX82_27145 [Cyanobacteriota bacterium]|nr:hypothetical protein [Cyanobacteriota bacterium]